MKKYLSILVILAVLIIPCLLLATGTVTQTYTQVYSSEGNTNLSKLTFVWTTDSSGNASATTNTTITDQIAGKYIVVVSCIPSSVDVPTTLYDVTITDTNGLDVVGGILLNRTSGATGDQATPFIGALYGPRPISTALTWTVANAGSGKSGTGILELSRQR